MPNTVMLLAMIETGETEEFARDLIGEIQDSSVWEGKTTDSSELIAAATTLRHRRQIKR